MLLNQTESTIKVYLRMLILLKKSIRSLYVIRNQSFRKVYRTRFSKEETRALQDVDFKVEEGEFIAIMGKVVLVRRLCSTF